MRWGLLAISKSPSVSGNSCTPSRSLFPRPIPLRALDCSSSECSRTRGDSEIESQCPGSCTKVQLRLAPPPESVADRQMVSGGTSSIGLEPHGGKSLAQFEL